MKKHLYGLYILFHMTYTLIFYPGILGAFETGELSAGHTVLLFLVSLVIQSLLIRHALYRIRKKRF